MERGEESCLGNSERLSKKVKIEEPARCTKKREGQRGGRRGAKMRKGVRGCEDDSCVCSPWLTSLPVSLCLNWLKSILNPSLFVF